MKKTLLFVAVASLMSMSAYAECNRACGGTCGSIIPGHCEVDGTDPEQCKCVDDTTGLTLDIVPAGEVEQAE
jgi:hypothetical protein